MMSAHGGIGHSLWVWQDPDLGFPTVVYVCVRLRNAYKAAGASHHVVKVIAVPNAAEHEILRNQVLMILWLTGYVQNDPFGRS